MRFVHLVVAPVALLLCMSDSLGQAMHTFARFQNATDTIRVHGNTVFNSGDFTYELNVWLDGPFGGLIKEQADSQEDKAVKLGEQRFLVSGCYTDVIQGDFRGTPSELTAGAWHHIAWVRHDGTATLFIDGTVSRVYAGTTPYPDYAGSDMSIGMFRYLGEPSFIGKLDWMRVSGVARYTGNFVPPQEAAIAPDANTQLLLKFDEPPGTTALIDESPNHFVCDVGVPVVPSVTATSPLLGQTDCVPVVLSPPAPVSVTPCQSSIFSVQVDGPEPLTYRWRRNGVPLNNGPYVSGEFSPTLTIASHYSLASGAYDAVVTSPCGTVTSSAGQLSPSADPADYDGDGNIGTDADIAAFFACLGGNCCPACLTVDLNGDGDLGTDADIAAFFRVLAGGNC